MSVVLGVDPGSQICGVAFVEDQGRSFKLLYSTAIDLRKEPHFYDRLWKFGSQLEELVREFKPAEVAVESLIYAKNPNSLMKLAQFRGTIVSVLGDRFKNLIFDYPPNKIKKVVAGYGLASKESVAQTLKILLRDKTLDYKTADESDAIAIALCHCLSGARLSKSRLSESRFSESRL